jgi:hypothetical protein
VDAMYDTVIQTLRRIQRAPHRRHQQIDGSPKDVDPKAVVALVRCE